MSQSQLRKKKKLRLRIATLITGTTARNKGEGVMVDLGWKSGNKISRLSEESRENAAKGKFISAPRVEELMDIGGGGGRRNWSFIYRRSSFWSDPRTHWTGDKKSEKFGNNLARRGWERTKWDDKWNSEFFEKKSCADKTVSLINDIATLPRWCVE